MEKGPSILNEYLEKRLENGVPLDLEQKKHLKKLEDPLIEIDYKESESFEKRVGDLTFKISYDNKDINKFIDTAIDMAKESVEEQGQAEGLELGRDEALKNLKNIREYKLKINDLEIDLVDSFSPEFREQIIFEPSEDFYAAFSPDGGFTMLSGKLSSPWMIFSILHEAGHSNRLMTKKIGKTSKGLEDGKTGISQGELADLLKEERIAWSFALRKIRPFLKSLGVTKADLLSFVHQFALNSYSSAFKKYINKRLAVNESINKEEIVPEKIEKELKDKNISRGDNNSVEGVVSDADIEEILSSIEKKDLNIF